MNSIYRLFRGHKKLLFLTMCCSTGTIAVTLFWNHQLAQIINDVQRGIDFGMKHLVICIILVGSGAFLQGCTHLFAAYSGEYAAHDLRIYQAKVSLKKPYYMIIHESAGEQISGQYNETEEINQYISDNLFSFYSMVINFLFTIIYLLKQNMGLTLLYITPVLFLTMYTIFSGKVIYGYTIKEQEQNKRMNGITGNMLMLFPITLIYDAKELLQRNFYQCLNDWQKASVAEERIKARLMSLSGILSCLPLALLMLAGGTMVVKGTLSPGMLYVFLNLSGNVSGVMMNFPGHWASFRRFCGNLDRVWDSGTVNREEGF